jgi:hypothetical protein
MLTIRACDGSSVVTKIFCLMSASAVLFALAGPADARRIRVTDRDQPTGMDRAIVATEPGAAATDGGDATQRARRAAASTSASSCVAGCYGRAEIPRIKRR